MDYEFRIKLAEKELAHLREMQVLMQEHQGAHDASFTVVSSRMDRTEANLEKLAALQVVTEQKLQNVADKLENLIDVLVRGQRNGHA